MKVPHTLGNETEFRSSNLLTKKRGITFRVHRAPIGCDCLPFDFAYFTLMETQAWQVTYSSVPLL